MDMLGKFLDTKDKMTKMTILLASSALLILVIKNNEKMLTTKLTNSLLLLVVLGSLFLGYLINEEPDLNLNNLSDDDENESLSDLSLTNTTISEPFQDVPSDNNSYNEEYVDESVQDPVQEPVQDPDQVPVEESIYESSVNQDLEFAEDAGLEQVDEPSDNSNVPEDNASVAETTVSVSASDVNENNFASIDLSNEPKTLPESCFPKDVLNASELLPKDSDTAWAENVPAGQGELKDQNFLNAGYHVGVNTVGQSLRNANRQLRSDPPCPQVKVSPWLQSTIEPDTNRRGLEIN